jgi:cytoskeletal protein CcmA (bactofilin family)
MAIFGKSKPAVETRAPQPRSAAAPAGGLSIIGVGMTVRGDLETAGVVKVEGTVDGHVKAKAQVLIAKGGLVHGDVETAEAVVGGTVNGAIRASNRVEVQPGAAVDGDITTRRIAVAEGGSLNGLIRMEESVRAAKEAPAGAKTDARVPASATMPSAPLGQVPVPPGAAGKSAS